MESLLLKCFHLLLFDSKEFLELLKMVHENSSSLKSSLLNHNLRLGEQLKEVFKNLLRDTEESGSILFCRLFEIVFLTSDLDHKVGPEIKHKLILSEERILW